MYPQGDTDKRSPRILSVSVVQGTNHTDKASEQSLSVPPSVHAIALLPRR